jgi:predicted RNase H-like HicB family nuclease
MKGKEQEYLAVFLPEDTGGYTVMFPMLPGCVTCGETFEEAKAMAQEALELWLEVVPSDAEYPTGKAIVDRITVSVPAKRKRFGQQGMKQPAKRYAAVHVA